MTDFIDTSCIRKELCDFSLVSDGNKRFFKERISKMRNEANVIEFLMNANEKKVRLNHYRKVNDEWLLDEDDTPIFGYLFVYQTNRFDKSVHFALITEMTYGEITPKQYEMMYQAWCSSNSNIFVENDSLVEENLPISLRTVLTIVKD